MEAVLGALPSLLPKLGELLKDEYNLQKEVKGGIRFLQAELETMKAALEDISKTSLDQRPSKDKIWARNVRELSYDIEDSIDTFMVQVKKGGGPGKKHDYGFFKTFINKTLCYLTQPKIRRKIATDIREIKGRVTEVHERRRRYDVSNSVDKLMKVDARALVRYEDVSKLVGINEARDKVIKLMMEDRSKQHNKILSIVGFGGLGKTTLANAVYQKLMAQFDCSAFVSLSHTPDMDKLFKDMFYQLAKYKAASIDTINVINELKEFLHEKRYLIIVDDIWEISYWNMIRCALSNNDGYRIITTTRILSVAEQIGGVFKMSPLSLENSRMLMYGRIFGKDQDKGKCPDEQLTEVCDRILMKCAGVPLAIITIASLLASKERNKLEWYNVYKSIGTGLEENTTIENIRNVLSLSYYDMPSHLRTCLLYLSMFPEDYVIETDRLIWLWIAEGFIQSGEQEKRLFEIGECYLNELINRSMVQPKYNNYSGKVISCCVHDMVLELIRSLSNEENFVAIWNHVGHSSTSEKIRRLSFQSGKGCHHEPEANMSIEYVRSVVVFRPAIGDVPILRNFRVLRVLDLQDCDLSQGYSLKYLGNLLHLRHLGLRDTCIDHLPKEIGNLQFLQTLDVEGNGIYSLPSSTTLLRHLLRLHIGKETRVPKGIESPTALEELSWLGIHDASTCIIEELGHLNNMRSLEIVSYIVWNTSLDKSLVKSLNKLHKIQTLQVIIESGECNLDGWGWLSPLDISVHWVYGIAGSLPCLLG
ncbi:hypothetical protein U9M48_043728 [Paspalum notatum var. saurae]|uniref:Uncharacterized protein n=1 Tax=Paspalum notatum var. saurae TaxID=547442 RepID=A0AAQ3XGS3_PASNO